MQQKKITDEPATFTSESGDLSDLFEEDSSAMEVGSFSYGWPDERDVFSYSGEALDIPFKLMGTKEGAPQEVGLLLFVNGIAQPYSIAFDDGTELADAYMQTFQLEQDVENIFHLIFQPVTGKAGGHPFGSGGYDFNAKLSSGRRKSKLWILSLCKYYDSAADCV